MGRRLERHLDRDLIAQLTGEPQPQRQKSKTGAPGAWGRHIILKERIGFYAFEYHATKGWRCQRARTTP